MASSRCWQQIAAGCKDTLLGFSFFSTKLYQFMHTCWSWVSFWLVKAEVLSRCSCRWWTQLASHRNKFKFISPVLNLHSSASCAIRDKTLFFVSASFPGLKLMRLLHYCRDISCSSFKGQHWLLCLFLVHKQIPRRHRNQQLACCAIW